MSDQRELDGWFLDAVAALEHEIPSGGAPDFLDVVERAHARAPGRVSAAMVHDARQLAPVVELRRASVEHHDPAFDAFLAEARGGLEHAIGRDVQAARAAGEEPSRAPAGSRRSVSRRLAWVGAGGLGVVAAASMLAFFSGVFSGEPLTPRPAPALASAALDRHDAATFGGTFQARRKVMGSRATAIVGGDRQSASVLAEALPEDVATPPKAAGRDEGESASDGPRAWAELAQARWRAGDLESAERLLTQVVRQAGRSTLAEMAYADLFSLAHRRHGVAERVRLWKSYLRRFPSGRFAEDALAGVCRADGTAACWRTYEARFPAGVYRVEARARLGREAPSDDAGAAR